MICRLCSPNLGERLSRRPYSALRRVPDAGLALLRFGFVKERRPLGGPWPVQGTNGPARELDVVVIACGQRLLETLGHPLTLFRIGVGAEGLVSALAHLRRVSTSCKWLL